VYLKPGLRDFLDKIPKQADHALGQE